MRRVMIFAGLWFLFWIAASAAFAVVMSGVDSIISGAMNGAWIAMLTSFVWPLLLPEKIERWMDR